MRLADGSGTCIELDILGYEFPNYECEDRETDIYDANWLKVQIAITAPELGEWVARGPFLLTYEVRKLRSWLNGIRSGKQPKAILRFIESNLWFELRNDANILRVNLELEARPDWPNAVLGTEDPIWVELRILGLDLSSTDKALSKLLDDLPLRCMPS